MWSLYVFFTVLMLSLSIAALCGMFLVLQVVVERFILQTLPLLVELYASIKYPDTVLNNEQR